VEKSCVLLNSVMHLEKMWCDLAAETYFTAPMVKPAINRSRKKV